MVQHREAHHGREAALGQRQLRGVAVDDTGAPAPVLLEQARGALIDLDGGQARHLFDQHAEVGPVARAQLQYVLAQFDVLQGPGQQLLAHAARPLL